MKRLILILFILSFSFSGFARLKSKQIIGEWKYVITLFNGQNEGSFVFFQKNGELRGEAIQSDGIIFTLSKIKVNKKNNTLCFEIPRENDVAIEFILTVDKNKFKGKGWINDADMEITGKRI